MSHEITMSDPSGPRFRAGLLRLCTWLTRVFPKCRFSLSRSRVGLALCISNKLLRIWLLVGGVGHTAGSNGGDLDLDAN